MWFNTFVIWLLTSPAHGLISRSTMLLHVHGKKSGNLYHIPVNYIRDGDVIYTISSRDRTWWRNLRGGAPLSIHLSGNDVTAFGMVIEEESAVVDALRTLFTLQPKMAGYFKLKPNANGDFDSEALQRVAAERLVIKMYIGQEALLARQQQAVESL
jgi:hypothetical protein